MKTKKEKGKPINMIKNKAVIFVYYNGHGGIGEDVEKSDDF